MKTLPCLLALAAIGSALCHAQENSTTSTASAIEFIQATFSSDLAPDQKLRVNGDVSAKQEDGNWIVRLASQGNQPADIAFLVSDEVGMSGFRIEFELTFSGDGYFALTSSQPGSKVIEGINTGAAFSLRETGQSHLGLRKGAEKLGNSPATDLAAGMWVKVVLTVESTARRVTLEMPSQAPQSDQFPDSLVDPRLVQFGYRSLNGGDVTLRSVKLDKLPPK